MGRARAPLGPRASDDLAVVIQLIAELSVDPDGLRSSTAPSRVHRTACNSLHPTIWPWSFTSDARGLVAPTSPTSGTMPPTEVHENACQRAGARTVPSDNLTSFVYRRRGRVPAPKVKVTRPVAGVHEKALELNAPTIWPLSLISVARLFGRPKVYHAAHRRPQERVC